MNEEQLFTSDQDKDKIFNQLHNRLSNVDSNLVFEISKLKKDGTKEFTISADGIASSFPAVTSLVNAAPKFIKWKINAFRQRDSGDDLCIRYDDSIEVCYEDLYFSYEMDANKIGIDLSVRNFRDSRDFDNAIYILLDGLIGEYDMATKVSWIKINGLHKSEEESLFKIIELRKIMDGIK